MIGYRVHDDMLSTAAEASPVARNAFYWEGGGGGVLTLHYLVINQQVKCEMAAAITDPKPCKDTR